MKFEITENDPKSNYVSGNMHYDNGNYFFVTKTKNEYNAFILKEKIDHILTTWKVSEQKAIMDMISDIEQLAYERGGDNEAELMADASNA